MSPAFCFKKIEAHGIITFFFWGFHFLLTGPAALKGPGPVVGEALASEALTIGEPAPGAPAPGALAAVAAGGGLWAPTSVSEGPNVNTEEGLCKQTRPKGFNVDTSSYFNEGDGLVSVRVTSSPHKKQQDESAGRGHGVDHHWTEWGPHSNMASGFFSLWQQLRIGWTRFF